MIRLHVADDLTSGARLRLPPEQARYLTVVMRLQVGEAVDLFNGRDGEWRATLAEAGRRDTVLQLDGQVRPQAFGPDLDLLIALVKRSRLETIVEKAAELGCRRVRPVLTRRTNADHTRVDRLQAIATEASEQTGRLDVPHVAEPRRLEKLLTDWEPGRRLLYCDEAGDDPGAQWGGGSGRTAPALEALRDGEPGSWAVLIGPEGGFAPEERSAIRALPFATAVTLGPRILRADTAAISALTLWQAALGDWRRA